MSTKYFAKKNFIGKKIFYWQNNWQILLTKLIYFDIKLSSCQNNGATKDLSTSKGAAVSSAVISESQDGVIK